MDPVILTALSIGGTVVLSVLGGFFGVSYKVGKWNGTVTKTLEDQDARIEKLESAPAAMAQTTCDGKMDVIHKRHDEHLKGHAAVGR